MVFGVLKICLSGRQCDPHLYKYTEKERIWCWSMSYLILLCHIRREWVWHASAFDVFAIIIANNNWIFRWKFRFSLQCRRRVYTSSFFVVVLCCVSILSSIRISCTLSVLSYVLCTDEILCAVYMWPLNCCWLCLYLHWIIIVLKRSHNGINITSLPLSVHLANLV